MKSDDRLAAAMDALQQLRELPELPGVRTAKEVFEQLQAGGLWSSKKAFLKIEAQLQAMPEAFREIQTQLQAIPRFSPVLQAVAEGQKSLADLAETIRRKRKAAYQQRTGPGRPRSFSTERFREAQRMVLAGLGGRAGAGYLHNTENPTENQIRGLMSHIDYRLNGGREKRKAQAQAKRRAIEEKNRQNPQQNHSK